MLLGSARPNQSKALQVLAAGAGMLPFFLFRRKQEVRAESCSHHAGREPWRCQHILTHYVSSLQISSADSVPSFFTCPITMELFRDPVVLGATGKRLNSRGGTMTRRTRTPPLRPSRSRRAHV